MNKRLYVDFHILQTVPPSCINRDDTGSPKTAVYGGVLRARVSSQAWKHAMRAAFAENAQLDVGKRTKKAAELVKAQILALAPELDTDKLAKKALENSFLLFIGKDPLVGHNIAFDLEFLRMTCKRYGFPAPTNRQIDLAQLARRNLTRIANYKLVTLAQHFQLAEKVEHRALPDCRLIQQVYCKLKETAVQ